VGNPSDEFFPPKFIKGEIPPDNEKCHRQGKGSRQKGAPGINDKVQ
jgi:hypothetical protein